MWGGGQFSVDGQPCMWSAGHGPAPCLQLLRQQLVGCPDDLPGWSSQVQQEITTGGCQMSGSVL